MNNDNFFREGSPFLQHPLLTPERTKGEVDFLLQQMHLSPGARVLDVGCGFGRHTIELALRGFQVTGIDPSAAMIAAARERALAADVRPQLQQSQAEAFSTDLAFDAAICLFTTLGQITAGSHSEADLVARVHRALATGAPFAVEVPQREPAVRRLKAKETFGEGSSYTRVTRHFDPASNTVEERFLVVSPQKEQDYHLRYRLFSHRELKALLREAGFAVRASFGNYAGAPLHENDATMLVIAEAL
jgi:SAM-dependent methyltransferase